VPINAIFLYMLSFYLLMLALGVNPWLAAGAAIAYAFSTFNIVIIEAGHMLQAYAMGTAPFVLAAAIYTLRSRRLILGGGLFALAISIHLATNHPQISYYTGMVFMTLMVIEFITYVKNKDVLFFFKASAVFVLGLILAIGSTYTFQATTYEYSKETIRGKSELTKPKGEESTGLDKEYALAWSYGIGETFSLLIPDARGGGSPNQDARGRVHGQLGDKAEGTIKELDEQSRQIVANTDAYWGSQPFTSGPFYFGAIICFLFVFGLVYIRGPIKWWALAVTILSIVLSWGKNFTLVSDFFFNYVPFYNKFRSVNFNLFMATMVFPILSILALDRFLKNKVWDKEIRRKFFIALGITGGLCLIFFIMPSVSGDFLKPVPDGDQNNMSQDYYDVQRMLSNPQNNLSEDQVKQIMTTQWPTIESGIVEGRQSVLSKDAGRSLVFILLAAGLIYLFMTNKIKREWVIGGIGVLILIDLGGVDRRYLNEDYFRPKSNKKIYPQEADLAILQDTSLDYRVLNLTVSPFNDATTSYFHKSVGGYHGAKLRRFQEMREKYLDQVVNVMQQNLGRVPPQTLIGLMQSEGQLNIINMFNTKYFITGPSAGDVVKNDYAYGNAWFVKGIKNVPNADEELNALGHTNPADTAIVNGTAFNDYLQGFTQTKDSSATIRLTSYAPNHLTYQTNSTGEGLAVFSEIYYDNSLGWNSYIDGQPVKHIRADYVLRAMRIPAGKHTIEFKFEPATFAKAEKITLASSLALLLLVAGSIYYGVKKKV
jgi:hypothetical protein